MPILSTRYTVTFHMHMFHKGSKNKKSRLQNGVTYAHLSPQDIIKTFLPIIPMPTTYKTDPLPHAPRVHILHETIVVSPDLAILHLESSVAHVESWVKLRAWL